MRYLFLFFFFFCLHIAANGQRKKTRFELESFDAINFKPLAVEISTKGKPALQTHFHSVAVLDMRADKSKLGFARTGEKIEDRRFIFPGEDPHYLATKISKLFSGNVNSSDTITLVLKNLWLYETQQQASAVKRELLGEIQLISHCFIACDVYSYSRGIATSLGTIDTVLTTNGWIVNRCNDLLKNALLASLTKCDSMFQANTSMATADLRASDFDFPIFSVESPQPGVYFTLKDFLNNNPDTSPFQTEIKTKKRILKSSRFPDSVVAKCWGYSDGSAIYMNINKDFYRLNRSQKAFDLRGPVFVDIKTLSLAKFSGPLYRTP